MGEHTVEPFVTAASGLGGALERLLCWSLMSPGGQYSTLHHYNIAAICSLWLHRLWQHQQRFNLNHLKGYVVFQDRKATSFLSPLYNVYAQTFACRDRQNCLNFYLKLPFSRLVLLGHEINKSRRFSRSIPISAQEGVLVQASCLAHLKIKTVSEIWNHILLFMEVTLPLYWCWERLMESPPVSPLPC